LTAKRESLVSRYDELISEATDQIVNDAQGLEKRLENMMGEAAAEELKLGEKAIVGKGEKVGREHIVLVQEVTGDRLTEEQKAVAERQEAESATLEREIGAVEKQIKEAKDSTKDQLTLKLARLRQQAQTNREQLENLQQMGFLNESDYRELRSKFGNVFRADMGAEAFYDILKKTDLDELALDLWREVRTTRSKQAAKRATKRLRVVESLRSSGNRPEWMILTVLPVIPPDLRPMVQLDGGRFATSDLNDLYRRVINRNNRLKKLLELGAPDVIVRNEKRMLQEAVDSLIDNSQRGKALSRRGRRELKSLSDMLKGKKGRFRRNLLGKRVDYSGRSVIVVGPKLKLGQCGLPKTMALELFRPFVIGKLVEYGYASNIKGAKRVIERQPPEVWKVLEEVVQGRPILLNRAPTLHRLGIQAFMPILVEGKAIQLHPLVCAAFNADFDGDQMAVHVPLSQRAVKESMERMLATNNLLKPSDGHPIVGPSKDMVLGIYYLTSIYDGRKGEGGYFSDFDEIEMAFELGYVDIHAKINLRVDTYFTDEGKRYADGNSRQRMVVTSPGRAIFNRAMPEEMQFANKTFEKGSINAFIDRIYRRLGPEPTISAVDAIKDLGFKYATLSGVTIAVSDLIVPESREGILADARAAVDGIDRNFRRGLLTEEEQYSRTIDTWTKAKEDVEVAVRDAMDPVGPVTMMAMSGSSKGGIGTITQLAGMRGLMSDPQGRVIAVPITSNFRQGLTSLEYFISTHGARKGLADTALRTADAGYLTRRLVDVAQDLIILDDDCGTEEGILINARHNFGKQNLAERIIGRSSAVRIVSPETGEILADAGQLISEEMSEAIDAEFDEVLVRSTMNCELDRGICAKCYGTDLATGKMVKLGSAIGIIAAQSIGEPGTQLTLRTFHTGGTADAGDITQGLPRVEELFEARQSPKGEAVMTEIGGRVDARVVDNVRHVFVTSTEDIVDTFEIPKGWTFKVRSRQNVDAGQVLAENEESGEVVNAVNGGKVGRSKQTLTVTWERVEQQDYAIPAGVRLLVKDGAVIHPGDQLTEGSKNPHRILEILGRNAVSDYLLREVQRVYRPQGQNINDKHFEVIIRKMLSKVRVVSSGDTDMLPEDLVDAAGFRRLNAEVTAEGGQEAAAQPVLMGITKASLNTESFLSASSFQHTIKVLARAAIAGKKDNLVGLKENVIIGKLIPAGTGYDLRQERKAAQAAAESLAKAGAFDEASFASQLIDDNTPASILDAIASANRDALESGFGGPKVLDSKSPGEGDDESE